MTATASAAGRVWDALCRHIDGMAIGTTMAALHERGALAMLAGQDRTEFGPLRERLAANAGFLHVALRLLADQGWVARQGEPGTDEMTIAPTSRGRVVMTELAGAYPAAVRSLPVRAGSRRSNGRSRIPPWSATRSSSPRRPRPQRTRSRYSA